MTVKALFLDRDGIVNQDIGYLFRPEECVFIKEIFALCKFFMQQQYKLFIITNQAGIAKGLYTEADFLHLTTWIEAKFAAQNLPIEKTYYCPHHPYAKIAAYKKICKYRKPQAGMLFQAAQEFNLDLTASILIGDKNSDMQTAQIAGIKRYYLIKSRYQANFDYLSVAHLYQALSTQNCG